jgi:hypothetical protein
MKRFLRAVLVVLLLVLAGSAPKAPLAAAQEARPGPDPLDEFIPHEKVPADSVVAFPVDI